MVDYSEAPKFPKENIVHQQALNPDRFNALELLKDSRQQIAAKDASVDVTPIGQISKMQLPKNWDESFKEPYTGIGHRSYSEVRLHGDKDVAISFFYRGQPLTDQNQAKAFHDIVSASPHQLSASEIKSIPEVLQDKANSNDFSMLSARTQNLSGKNVLIVEGRYKALQQDAYHVYVDSDGTGRNVQEVFYQAPKDKYPAHLKEAKDSFDSIRWK